MVKWIKFGRLVSSKSPPSTAWGFVYIINYTNGKSYIGKKQFWSVTKKAFGKKKLAEITDRRAKKYEMVTKENNWRQYIGSSKETDGFTIASKEILEVCSDKINLTYCEVKWMIALEVLTKEKYVNSNILGKFFVSKVGKSSSMLKCCQRREQDEINRKLRDGEKQ